MKKYLIITAVFAAILASCSKDKEIETEDKIGGGITEFEADIPDSKTYLGDKVGSAWPNYWSNGDVINVHGVASKALKTGDGYVGTNYAKFTMNSAVSAVGGKYYSAYPSSKVSSWSSGSKTATVTIPATQTFTSGSYDSSAYIMVGSSSTQKLNFNPVMGLIQLTTTPPAEGTLYIKSISVEPVGDEKMSGAFTTNYSTISASGSATSSVTISANTGSGSNATKAFGTVFTFAVPAQNYASGIRFRITAVPNADGTGDEQVAVFSKQSAFNVAAGTLYPLTAPAFKESAVTFGDSGIGDTKGLYALTSSSVQVRWNGSSVSNNRKKTWRIHAYTNSTCTTEFGSGWTIPKSASACWDETNSYLTFIVGGLSRNTTYWFKIEDVQNGVFSDASSSITTESFTQVSMPASITSTGVVFAEDFNELSWGSTSCGRRSAGFRPSNTSSFSNISTDGATFYKFNSWFSFRDSELNSALTSSRLNNWMSEGDVTAHPGHLKLGTGSTAGWIVTPAFPVASGKSAIVNVTLNAMKYEKDAQSDYAIAVLSSSEVGTGSGNRESSFTWPDTSDESLYQTVSFSSEKKWESDTAEGLVLKPGDRIVIGRRDGGGNTNPRLYVNSVSVEVTSMCFEIKDVATLQSFMTNKPAEAIVTADINMSGQSFTTISGYTGTLYGNGHTISGLTVPMFDELQGTVRDLTLISNLNITTKHDSSSGVGIFANKMTSNASLIGCTSKGSLVYCPSSAVTSGEIRVGGVVGYLNRASLTDCRNEASVTLNDNGKSNTKAINIGGITGQTFCKEPADRQYVTSCINAGNVTNNCNTSGAIYVGGVIGKPYKTTLEDCRNENESTSITISNSGKAGETGTNQLAIGGAFGMIQSDCIVKGVCYNKEAVSNTGTGAVRLGGFVGQADVKNTYNASSSTYHYNDGTVTENSESTTIYVGGFCGHANNANVDISYCRNNGDINIVGGTRETIYVGGVIGRTSAAAAFNYVQNSGDIDFSGVDVSGQVFCGGVHGGWDSDNSDTQTVTGCVNSGTITADGSNGSDLASAANSKKWSLFGGISGVGCGDSDLVVGSSYTSTTDLQTVTGKTFQDCSNTGAITLYLKLYFTVGGVVAIAGNNPSGCSCVANIRVVRYQGNTTGIRNYCGGIAGYTHDDVSAISNVKYSGTLNTNSSKNAAYTGGIIGHASHGITFTNCKVGGTVRGAGSNPGASIFCCSSANYNYSFSSCAVKKGTVVYCYSAETIYENSNLNVGNCLGPAISSTNTDGTLATQVSVPTSL